MSEPYTFVRNAWCIIGSDSKGCTQCLKNTLYNLGHNPEIWIREASYIEGKRLAEARNRNLKDGYLKEIQQPSFEKSKGLTPSEYTAMLSNQNGLCILCEQGEMLRFQGKRMRLSIDHDHETGIVRGLLCTRCNLALGQIEERGHIKWAKRTINYLILHANGVIDRDKALRYMTTIAINELRAANKRLQDLIHKEHFSIRFRE